MTDAELAALEQRMIAAAPIVLEATADVSDDAGELPDGDVEDSRRMPLPDLALTQNSSAASLGVCPPIFDAPRTFPVPMGRRNPTHVSRTLRLRIEKRRRNRVNL